MSSAAADGGAGSMLADPATPAVNGRRGLEWIGALWTKLAPGGREWRARRLAVLAAIAAGVSALYAIGALLPFWFLSAPDAGAAFFPPAGITLAVLVLSPRSRWPLWLLVIGATEFLVDITHGQTVAMAIGFALANTAEPLVGATGIRASFVNPAKTFRQRLATFVVWGVVVGPLAGAAIGATVAVVFGGAASWFSVFGKWWLGDALGVLVIATPLLALTRRSRFEAHAGPFETGAIVLLATGMTIIPAVLWHHPIVYAIPPVLTWAALRGGSVAVSLAGVGVALGADWAAVTGRANDLIAPGSESQQLLFVQIFLGLTLLAALTLAVEVADRRRSEHAMQVAELERARADRTAAEIVQAERQRIARETHDIVGHALNVMLLQAGAARQALRADTGLAPTLLESLESVGRAAFRDLDVALDLVDERDLRPPRGLEGVPELVSVMRAAGMQIELDVQGDRGDISTLVDWSAYRIVREALTNVAKHAPGAAARVTIRYEANADTILSVVDDGGSPNGANGHREPWREGRGVIGMRERAAFLGGELRVAAQKPRGFAVHARLPAQPLRR